MKKGLSIYQLKHQFTSILMLLTLLWLTVSTPFVYASQLQLEEQQVHLSQSTQDDDSDDEQTCTPLGSTTEEKTPSGVGSLSEEYLHMDNELFHLAELSLNHTRYHTVSEYVAFHGELLCPPPNSMG